MDYVNIKRRFLIVLEYSKWEHFVKVINKTKIFCKLSDNNVDDHFPVNGKMVDWETGNYEVVYDFPELRKIEKFVFCMISIIWKVGCNGWRM